MNWSTIYCLSLAVFLAAVTTLHAAGAPGLERLGPHAFGLLAADEKSANSAVFVGEHAALVVDPGLTPAISRDFLERVQKEIGTVPIRYVVLTHWHPDHALGALCSAGPDVQIITHPFTAHKLRQQAGIQLSELDPGGTCTPHFPDVLIEDAGDFDLGGVTVNLFHPGHGHTAGDLVAWSVPGRVLVTGDIFMHAASPFLGESDPRGLANILDELVALNPLQVVGGHFGLSAVADLERFRDYMKTLVAGVENGLEQGLDGQALVESMDFEAFSDFGQYPQYNATFAGNTGDVAAALKQEILAEQFSLLARLDVGQAPHQVSFSEDGGTAYIAAAGSDKITIVDTEKLEITGEITAPGVPLGVIPLTDGQSLAVTRFQGDSVVRYSLADGAITGELTTGGAPSLIQGPFAGNQYLVAVEKAGSVWVLNADTFEMQGQYPVGRRPFPASATSDGKLAFVPNYDDGTVTVVDLRAQQVKTTVAVGEKPSGGAVLPGDEIYAVVVRGENRIALMNINTFEVTGSITEGIGESPFSVVVSADGRRAFVNNTTSNDVSVIDLASQSVLTRIKTGEIPIVMAVHPDGKSLWVSCEGSHDVYVIQLR